MHIREERKMTGSTEIYSPDEVVSRGKALYESRWKKAISAGCSW